MSGPRPVDAEGGILLRRMRWWDIEPVAVIDAELFGADAWSREYFWSELAAPGRSFTVAVDEGDDRAGGADSADRILGFCGLSVSGPDADILTIGTAPAAQRRGIARRLLADAVDAACSAGAEALHLDVAADNAPALALYAAFGFEELGRRPGYYRSGDAVIMRALLSRPEPTA